MLLWLQLITVVLAIVLVALSNFFFGTGENLIAAFLPELARRDALGRVSGWGWAFGYLGGMLALWLCLGYVLSAQARGDLVECGAGCRFGALPHGRAA